MGDHLEGGGADGGQHAGLAKAQPGAPSDHRLTPADIGAGVGDIAPGHRRPAHPDAGRIGLCVLDHHHGIRPTGHNGAGGDRHGRTGFELEVRWRRLARRQRQVGHSQRDRLQFLGPERVGGAHGVAVHVAAVERRNVDGGDYVGRQHPPARRIERNRLGARLQVGACLIEPLVGHRLVDNVEELALLHSGTSAS